MARLEHQILEDILRELKKLNRLLEESVPRYIAKPGYTITIGGDDSWVPMDSSAWSPDSMLPVEGASDKS